MRSNNTIDIKSIARSLKHTRVPDLQESPFERILKRELAQQKRAVASLNGTVKATASLKNPNKITLDLFLTSFEPNGNKQAIPVSEAENIVRTAFFTPVLANFDGVGLTGHTGAKSVGVISDVIADDKEIRGVAVLWRDHNPELSQYLLDNPDSINSSFEVLYTDSTIDANGVEWFKDVVFSGICLVDVPAYGTKAKGKIV